MKFGKTILNQNLKRLLKKMIRLRKANRGDCKFLFTQTKINDIMKNRRISLSRIYPIYYLSFWLNLQRKSLIKFIIQKDSKPIGYIAYLNQELEYFIIPEYQGQGYCSKSLRMFLRYLHSKGIDKIYAETYEFNDVSNKILSKNGFKIKEAIFEKVIQ